MLTLDERRALFRSYGFGVVLDSTKKWDKKDHPRDKKNGEFIEKSGAADSNTPDLLKFVTTSNTVLLDIDEPDPVKNQKNIDKHKISLYEAARFDLDSAVPEEEKSLPYEEQRFKAIGFIESQLHVLIYTMRGDKVRPISLRKAEKKEVKHYVLNH